MTLTETETATEQTTAPTNWFRNVSWFVVVGLVATTVHVAVAWLFIGLLPDLAANAVGFAVALGVTYLGNYFLTFRAAGDHRETIIRFLVISAVTLGVSEWILVFFRMMGAAERISVLVAVIAIPTLRFGMLASQVFDNRRWQATPLRQWAVDVAVWSVAPVIGILALLAMAPDGLLDADSDVWLYPEGDRGTGVAGMRYYLADDWHWPLLRTDDLNTPDGTIVAFTDSLPILAFPAKLARPLIGSEVNYFPSWFLMAYTLQAVGAVALLRSLRVRRPEALLAGATLAVAFPPFIFRAQHVALEGHFIILLTLAAAFGSGAGPDGSNHRRNRVLTAAALVAALLIHPYLLFMTAPLVAGIYLDHLRRGRMSLTQLVATGGGSVAALLGVLVTGGYLGRYASDASYGQYGLNLLSPVYPQLSGLLPGDEGILLVGATRWEGFNWLGFGALLTIAAAVAMERRRLIGLVSRWRALTASAAVVSAVAVSHIVTYGTSGEVNLKDSLASFLDRPGLAILVTVVISATAIGAVAAIGVKTSAATPSRSRRPGNPLIAAAAAIAALAAAVTLAIWATTSNGDQLLPLLSNVRASGRLWWSIGLLLTLGAVAIIGRSAPRPVAAAILVLAAGLQIVDTGPVREAASVGVSSPITTPGPDQLRAVAETADVIRVWPSFFCAPFPEGGFGVLNAVVIASTEATPIDTAYTARRPLDLDCDGAPPTSVADDEALVLAAPARQDPGPLLTPDHSCRDDGQLLVCTAEWADVPAAATSPFAPVVAEPVTFGFGGDAPAVSGDGWQPARDWGRIVPDSGADLDIPLIGDVAGQLLTVRVRLRSATGQPSRLIATTSDGAEQAFDLDGSAPTDLEFDVVAPASGPLDLTLRSDPTRAPAGIDELTVVMA